MHSAAVTSRLHSPSSPPVTAPPRAASVTRTVAAFNTWAFKREQPSDPDLLEHSVARAVATGAPLPFVLYWGKGPRNRLAKPDEDCLDFLAVMARRIEAAHPPGAAVTLLLTDTHARLNRHSESAIDAYFAAIDDAAAERGFIARRLSDVVTAFPPAASAASNEAVVDLEVLDLLTKSASKWYGGDSAARLGAIEYYAMNLQEKRAVEAAYPHAIFITFNNSRFRVLFPDGLPIFYMYSLRKGFAVKPWFIDAAA